jgi:hypothetical protein
MHRFCSEFIQIEVDDPEVKIFCNDVIKVRSILLFYQTFEYADIFGLLNFDSEHLLQDITENQTVE